MYLSIHFISSGFLYVGHLLWPVLSLFTSPSAVIEAQWISIILEICTDVSPAKRIEGSRGHVRYWKNVCFLLNVEVPIFRAKGGRLLAQCSLCPLLWLFACLVRNDLQPMWDTNIPLSHSLYHPNGILSAEDKMWTKKAIIEWIS